MTKASQAGQAPRYQTDLLRRAESIVRRKLGCNSRLAMVLGSGFQGALALIQGRREVALARLPALPRPTVPGHEGTLVGGTLGGVPILALTGRAHFYEGHSLYAVTTGVRLLARLGVDTVLITNAAGGLNPRFRVGDFMMLTDHINFMGANPLRGTPTRGGACFVDMTQAYDPQLQSVLRRAARRVQVSLRSGVYLAVSGPSYETPAEIRAYRRLGADAIGMSTVPEVIVARHEGLRVAGLSCITNLAAGTGSSALDHNEVLHTGARVSGPASQLLEEFASLYGQS